MANKFGSSNYVLLLVSALLCLIITLATFIFIFTPGLLIFPFFVAWMTVGALIYQWKEMIAAFLVIAMVLLAGLLYVIYPSRPSKDINKGTVIMAMFLILITVCLGLFLASLGLFSKGN